MGHSTTLVIIQQPSHQHTMFTLDQVVPWGRSYGEYRRMFTLSDADLRLRLFDIDP